MEKVMSPELWVKNCVSSAQNMLEIGVMEVKKSLKSHCNSDQLKSNKMNQHRDSKNGEGTHKSR